MLSSVLKSKRAIDVNIAIMRTFVKMREILLANKEFSEKLKIIEAHLAEHDEQFRIQNSEFKIEIISFWRQSISP